MKSNVFTRRQLLLLGLGTVTVARVTTEYMRNRSLKLQQQAISEKTVENAEQIIIDAYGLERDWENEILERRKILTATTKLAEPKINYNRQTSKLLIKACKLAVQQYKIGRSDLNYNGSLKLLPGYDSNFESYTQIASFKIEEKQLKNYFSLNEGSTKKIIYDLEGTVRETVQKILRGQERADLFIGFVLTSKTNNIIAFRGTQTQAEWLENLRANQLEYRDRNTNKSYGLVHRGFMEIVRHKIADPLLEIVRQLDPTIPCYITGHSLGSAIATVAALEIALNVPQIREQIQLYTYASPRVGNSVFAKAHTALIRNSYRIVNQSDFVPVIPPVTINNRQFKNEYIHVGQKWAFLTQYNDVLLNHVVDTYDLAIEAEKESSIVDTSSLPNLVAQPESASVKSNQFDRANLPQ